jgi:hypothetical protein
MRGNPLTCSRSHIRLPATLRTPLIRFGLSGYHPSGHGRFGRRRRTNAAARGPAGPFSPKTSAKTDATLVFKKIVKALALLFDFGVQRARQKFAVRPPRFLTRINLRLDRALRFHDARRTHVLPKGWAVGSTPCLGFRGAAASSFRHGRRDAMSLFFSPLLRPVLAVSYLNKPVVAGARGRNQGPIWDDASSSRCWADRPPRVPRTRS